MTEMKKNLRSILIVLFCGAQLLFDIQQVAINRNAIKITEAIIRTEESQSTINDQLIHRAEKP